MSIFCSQFGLDEHKPGCARVRKLGTKSYEQNDSKPCTCGVSPILYQGSHVLPSKNDKRGGDFGFASIPPHITRNGKDNGRKPHPWLRFHLRGGFQDSLILNRRHVLKLRDALNEWLQTQEAVHDPR